MDARRLTKWRASRRGGSAGAAMFIVAMTLAVLASLGIYALAATQNEIRSSGNERQNTQTHYLAEYGLLGTVHEVAGSKAQYYVGLMLSQPDTPCVSLGTVPPTASILTRACRRLGSAEIAANWGGANVTDPYQSSVPYTAGANPGSFGPTTMTGDFFVELTEPVQTNAARYGKNTNMCFVELTATAVGLTRPTVPASGTDAFGAEGLETQRARIKAGPMQCPR